MKKIIYTLLLITSVNAACYAQANKEIVLTDTDKIYGLSKMWSEVKYNFVYYDKLDFDWDSLYVASIPKVLSTKTTFEYYRELQRICALLRDGHTTINMPWQMYARHWAEIPLVCKKVEDKIVVYGVFNDTLARKGIVKGTEVVKINNMEVQQYARQFVMPYIFSSTPQWTDRRTYIRDLTRGEKNEPAKITFKDSKGKLFDCEISRYMVANEPKDLSVSFKMLDGNIGLLTIRSFNDGDFKKIFDGLYDQIKTAGALIIDIRYNGGGNSSFADYVLRHLTDKPFLNNAWSSRMYIAANASWYYPQEWYMQSPDKKYPVEDKEVFTKPVAVVVNEGTFSAAEDFCVGFRNMKRGLIIGSATGGSTGNAVNFDLPGGGGMSICTKKNTYTDGTLFVGIGIKPDIEIKETVESIRKERDIVLEQAVKAIK